MAVCREPLTHQTDDPIACGTAAQVSIVLGGGGCFHAFFGGTVKRFNRNTKGPRHSGWETLLHRMSDPRLLGDQLYWRNYFIVDYMFYSKSWHSAKV